MSGRVAARLDGGRAHGSELAVPDAKYVYVAVVDGVPRTPDGADEDVLQRARGQWECYVRDTDQESDGLVAFFCMQPLDRGNHGRGTPPPPPARAGFVRPPAASWLPSTVAL